MEQMMVMKQGKKHTKQLDILLWLCRSFAETKHDFLII